VDASTQLDPTIHLTVLGGDGQDDLIGGADPDTIEGGADIDTLQDGAGNDTILALDGEADTIDCGEGHDTVAVDLSIDTVVGCEKSKN
jgi:Ca2+-binding RTX toxin-like protein